MDQTLREPARELPVRGEFDVVVVGGGVAGVAAALAARRAGASVRLIDKGYALGGLATLANVMIYLPLCDGHGRQVMGGLAEELLHLSVRDVGLPDKARRLAPVPDCWLPGGDLDQRREIRFRVEFNPASFLLELEALCLAEGVELLYDTRFCAVIRGDRRLEAVVVENKDGRSAIRCRTVVDASGDADVCWAAGEETEALDTNVLCGWFYYWQAGALKARVHSKRYAPDASRAGADGPFFRGDDARSVTDQVLQTRAWLRDLLAEWRAADPAGGVQPIQISTIPGLRMTRRLVGAIDLRSDDDHRWFDDAVGLTGDWRKRGPIYCLPLRALAGRRNLNLLAAGRCISADTTVWDVTRAIPTCVVTGEAAGTAAALAARQTGGDVSGLAVPELQARLRAQRVLLEPELLRA